jgi:hypothetical protein
MYKIFNIWQRVEGGRDGLFVEFSEKGQKSRSIGKVDQKGEYIYLKKYP